MSLRVFILWRKAMTMTMTMRTKINFLMIIIIIFSSFSHSHFELWSHGINLCSRSGNAFGFWGVAGLEDW